ncbi:MAG: hypothetical protein [Olavius algarvensis Delta 4 endosymbiont]|nr:MAG: hypothetical protein [Olavius algarvensis Delta 4 endosymbiont]
MHIQFVRLIFEGDCPSMPNEKFIKPYFGTGGKSFPEWPFVLAVKI